MVLGTYANLFATEQAISKKDVSPIVVNMANPLKPVENIGVNLPLQPENPDVKGIVFFFLSRTISLVGGNCVISVCCYILILIVNTKLWFVYMSVRL